MRMAWRLFWRDLRAGELTLLLAALVLAVTATTTLRFFSSSLEQAIHQQAGRLLGADMVLSSSRSIRPQWPVLAQQQHLRQSQTLEFSSVAQAGDNFQLSSIKAVSAGYPLRGQLKVELATHQSVSGQIPALGQVWVEERLLRLLNLTPGAALTIGEAQFTISGIITEDANLGGSFSAFAPNLIMNLADVPATHIIQPGSRVAYRLLLAGKTADLERFRQYAKPRLQPEERLRDVSASSRQLSRPLENAGSYLSLVTIAAVMLAGIAVALAANRYSERHLDHIALMRCLGAGRRQLARLFAQQLALVWLVAMLAGGISGFIGAHILFALLAAVLPVQDLSFDLLPALATGVATATLTLIGFALPAFVRLYQVSPLRVLRRELSPASWSTTAITALALAALFILLTLETGNLTLTGTVMMGGMVLALVLGRACLWLLQFLQNRPYGPALWRNTVLNLGRQPQATVTQVLALALGLTAVLLVSTIRHDLLQQWQHDLPANTPNQFAVTIPAEQVADIQQFLAQKHWAATPFYPVVRGRLTAINGQDTKQRDDEEKDDKKDESLKRELNLTWSTDLPPDNKLVAGQWLSGKGNEVSVEADLAKRLKLKLGDNLRLQMAEGTLDARITSLREVDWDNFKPNFYLIFPQHMLAAYPATYLTSFYVPPAERRQLVTLVQQFPTVVFVDLINTLGQVQKLLAQLTQGLQVILLFVVAAGFLVLLASIAASLDTRRQEAALLRALGAQRRQLQQRAGLELALLGLWAGVLSVIVTETLAAVLAVQVLDGQPHLHGWLWLAPLLTMMLTLGAGLLGLRRVWTVSPMLTLKE